MKKDPCHCSKKKPSGEWTVGTEGSFAKCECGGWYETDVDQSRTSDAS